MSSCTSEVCRKLRGCTVMSSYGTSADEEDIATNPLFSFIRLHCDDIWGVAARRGYAIIIPGRYSLTAVDRTIAGVVLWLQHWLLTIEEQHVIEATGDGRTFRTLDGRIIAYGDSKINTIKGMFQTMQNN